MTTPINYNPQLIPHNSGALIKHKNKIYSVKYYDQAHGYFLLPLNNSDSNLGFWAQHDKCQIILN